MKKYYLAYGSNLNVAQMQYRCPTAKPVGTARLNNHCLVFKGSKTGSYLTVEPQSDSYVPLGVWEVETDDEYSLDRYEGYPMFYYKAELPINVIGFDGKDKGCINAFIYIMNERSRYSIPRNDYVNTCIKGYKDFGFDKAILEKAVTETNRRTRE